MRFRFVVLLLLLAIVCPTGLQAQFLYWDYHNIADDVALSGAYPDMAIDQAGNLHVSYWHAEEDRLIYAYQAAGSSTWTREYVDASHPNGFRSAIAVDASNLPHIIYQENNAFRVEIRYAKRSAAGVWTVENIPSSNNANGTGGYGDYGPNSVNNVSERIKHGLDIIIDENQNPQVVFFDGYMAANAFPICSPSSLYGFKLHQAMRSPGGTWTERSFGTVPDLRMSCNTEATPTQLPAGDRYGEYAALVQRQDNTMDVFCLSRFNYRILNFQNTFPNLDTFWTRNELDSMTRYVYNDPAGVAFFDRYFTWEGISADVSDDDAVHLAYTSSVFYGENFCCIFPLNDMFYTKVTVDTVIYYPFGAGTYRNHTAIRARGNDSIYFTYHDLSLNFVGMQSSTDGGVTWALDTIRLGAASSPAPIDFVGDSIVVVSYSSNRDRLSRFKRHIAGGPWVEQVINASDYSAQSIDGYLHSSTSDTTVSTFYSDRNTGSLTFARGGTNSSFAFNRSVLAGASDVTLVAADRRANGDAVAVYAGGPDHSLHLAYGQPGNWSYAVVDTHAQVQALDMEVSTQDTVHIAFRFGGSNCLYHLKGHVTGSAWVLDTVDCDSLSVGEYISLQLDATQSPRIAYYASVDRKLMYAERGGSGWLLDSVNGGSASSIGLYPSMRIDAAGLPKIAYLNEQSTSVLLSEKDASGNWIHTEVDSVPITNIGRPIELELDGFGNVWIAYNYYNNFEKVKLMHRDTIWREVAVSTAGQIANAFFFRIAGADLYLTGRKNQLQNTGVALLRAGNGVFVNTPPPLLLRDNVQLSQAPNPFSGTTTFHLTVQQADRFSLGVYDLCGRPVASIFEGRKLQAGDHSFEWRADALPSGIYFYRLAADADVLTGKMILNR